MLSQSSASKRGMARRSDGSGVYKNAGKDQQRGTLSRTPQMCSVRQMSRDQRWRRADRSRRLQGEASPGEIEMVAAEGIHVAVIEAPRSQSEDEHDRRPVLQEPRQERGVRCFLRIRSTRGHDRFAELGREPSPRELERLETAEMRQLSEVLSRLTDARRAGHPRGDVFRRAELLLEWEPERGEVRIEGESDRCRARDRSAVRLGEANRVVRIVEAESDPAACHLTSMAVALFRYGADRKASRRYRAAGASSL